MVHKPPGSQMTPAERETRHAVNQAWNDTILELHVRGESLRAIEKATGVPRATVAKMVKHLAKDYVIERYGDHTTVLGRELHILDQLTRKNLGPATRGDEAAARIVLASHVRRSKLLGLEAAVKAEITVKTSTDIEIERLVAMLRDGPAMESDGLAREKAPGAE
jgi:hypothetical protein